MTLIYLQSQCLSSLQMNSVRGFMACRQIGLLLAQPFHVHSFGRILTFSSLSRHHTLQNTKPRKKMETYRSMLYFFRRRRALKARERWDKLGWLDYVKISAIGYVERSLLTCNCGWWPKLHSYLRFWFVFIEVRTFLASFFSFPNWLLKYTSVDQFIIFCCTCDHATWLSSLNYMYI